MVVEQLSTSALAPIFAVGVALGTILVGLILFFILKDRSRLRSSESRPQQVNITHYHNYHPETLSGERDQAKNFNDGDEGSFDSAAMEEAPICYGQLSTVKDATMLLRQRSTPGNVPDTPPPPYTELPDQPQEFFAQPCSTIHQKGALDGNGPRAFLETQEKTVPKVVGKLNALNEQGTEVENSPTDDQVSEAEDSSGEENQETEAEPLPVQQCPDADLENKPEEDGSLEPSTEEEIKVPIYKAESPTETFIFEVDKKGCCIVAPYCKVRFPPGARKHPVQIKMTPEYRCYTTDASKISICPAVNFESDDEMIFDKKVNLALHTNYTAVEKKVPVQVIWRKDCDSPFQLFGKDILHGNDRYISFTVKHFCGYSMIADESQLPNMQRHYYSAAYMRKPKNESTRILHWLIYEDCPAIIAQQSHFLTARDTVIDPEIFALRYNHNLQLGLAGQNIAIPRNDKRPQLADKWGLRVSESFQFKVEKNANYQGSDSDVQYEVLAMHTRSRASYPIIQKEFFLEWEREASDQGLVMNVNAPGAVGMSYNYGTTCERDLQHQTSNVSDASSGYSSALPTPSIQDQPFEHSLAVENRESVIVEQSQVEEQGDSVFDESPVTIPKSESFDSFALSPPLSHSTPQQAKGQQTNPKEGQESMESNDKSFTS